MTTSFSTFLSEAFDTPLPYSKSMRREGMLTWIATGATTWHGRHTEYRIESEIVRTDSHGSHGILGISFSSRIAKRTDYPDPDWNSDWSMSPTGDNTGDLFKLIATMKVMIRQQLLDNPHVTQVGFTAYHPATISLYGKLAAMIAREYGGAVTVYGHEFIVKLGVMRG